MKKTLAFISSDDFSYTFREALEEKGGFDVSSLKNFAEAREELSKKKFDIIYIELFGIPVGNVNDISTEEINKGKHEKKYFGTKLLTDVIRNKTSINNKTPVYILLDSERFGDSKQYLTLGADDVFIKEKNSYMERIDVMKKQTNQ